ncbi:6-aminohexanoate-dimer hydrolase [Mycolicibacterium mageritense DSM 44476 = CIP 104973]|uniref:Hydrolase n=1 Tax=Mycolicibacterium mageritense TaxID=53462 RepID=A0ABM7HKW5_MYCME|nr:serine hydrolase [Mycolicibacterium mageritense]MCC9182673.1 beta-lactamase family protein [Mycolicibacterium mageritense]BBX31134.1 hydrolase [Mycolicibacterium mageritense]CDO24883.1 hydrolase [Mycolicibacterium mageritense DSM 44476 = CIP 104973]
MEVNPQNWQQPPFNRWAYWHVEDVLPTQPISRGTGPVRPLPAVDAPDLLQVNLIRSDGESSTVGQVLDDTYTDAYVVLQDGGLVTEWYGAEGSPDRPHASMSITKSVVGAVAGVLVDRGVLDVSSPVEDIVGELAGSGYAGATVRDLLDMRSGVRFREEYTNPHSEIRMLDDWLGSRGLYEYLVGLVAEAPHGQRFLYRSGESDALGWVCERAAGAPMAELISTLIWQPMGAEFDAEILCDTAGTAIHDGGLCATARDLARFGQLLLDGGTVPDDGDDGVRTVIGPRWLRDAWAVDADARSVFIESPNELSMPGGWYRNQLWFRPGEFGDVLLCLGIHGQMVHVSRRTRTVCVKLSSWPNAQEPRFMQDTLRAFDAVGGELSGRQRMGDKHRLPGIVSGMSRHSGAGKSGKS